MSTHAYGTQFVVGRYRITLYGQAAAGQGGGMGVEEHVPGIGWVVADDVPDARLAKFLRIIAARVAEAQRRIEARCAEPRP